jgi:uncharacterized protein YndB with AHSA1/START domain
MTSFPHVLERTVVIQATRETVFEYFTDSARWAAWWGPGSTIDARPGGRVLIRYPNGVEVSGEVLDVLAPERIVFTYGYESGSPVAPGGSRVTIILKPHEAGTELHLSHEFAEASARDQHVQGWRYQLSVFANVVADEIHSDAANIVDGWFAAWSMVNDSERATTLARLAAPEVCFRDRFSSVDGLEDLAAHIAGSQRFMPDIRMQRRGEIRHCQGTVLADWIATGNDGVERMSGTNVFALGTDGRIQSVTGFLNPRATG